MSSSSLRRESTLQRINKIAKLTLNPLQSGYRSSNALNVNLDAIEAALENTLSRDGTTPNQMEAVLDMNDNRIINLAEPVDDNDAVRLVDVADAIALATDIGDIQASVDAAAAAQDAAQDAQAAAEAVVNLAALKANNLSDLANAATARTNLGLGTMAVQNSSAINVTGGTVVGITDLTVADGGTGASTASAALSNLGGVATATLALSSGASLIGFIHTGTGAASETVQAAIRRLGVFPEQYGAVSDMVTLTDGAISTGTPNFTSASASFVTDDVGKTIKIAGAGAAGVPLVTTILARVSATAVTLATNAGTTVSGKRFFYGTNNTTAIQNMLAASLRVRFDGQYLIAGVLAPRTGQHIEMTPRTCIVQTTSGVSMFKTTSRRDITFECNGAQLWGHGLFLGNPGGAWTGNTNSEDRAINLIDCDNVTISRPYIRDFGQSGVLLEAVRKAYILNAIIEGTHTHSMSIQWPFVSPGNQANFQNGISLVHSATYGPSDDINILNPEISGVAQAILIEWNGGPPPSKGINILGGSIHDIPGQHAFYIQSGGVNIVGTTLRRIALAGVKTQLGGGTVTDIEGCSYTGIDGEYLGSQLFEFGVPLGVGYIRGIYAQGRARQCGRLASFAINIENVELHVTGEDVYAEAIQFNGANLDDIRVYVNAKEMGGCGVRDYSDGADAIKFYDTTFSNINVPITDTFVTRAGQTTFTAVAQVASVTVNGGASTFTMGDGVFTPTTVPTTGQTVVATYTTGNAASNSALRFSGTNSSEFTFVNFEATDAGGTMYADVFLETGTPVVKMDGRVVLLDGTTYSARASSGMLTLPATTQIEMPYLGLDKMTFIGEPFFTIDSTGSTTSPRAAVPPATGTFMVEVTLLGKKSDNSQQKATILRRAFTYDGTTVTAVAATQETVIGASGTFDGTYSLVSGVGTTGDNTWAVLVSNSGGGTFNWKMQEKVITV